MPKTFPDLPVLAPAPAEPGDGLRAELMERTSDGGWQPGEWVYVHSDIGRSGQSVRVKIPWQWTSQPLPTGTGKHNMNLNWPPVDYLITATSLHAMKVAVNQRDQVRIEPFDGGLHDGVDIKTTLRAHARGDDKVFVRDVRYRRKPSKPGTDEWDPLVWIFRAGHEPGANWEFMGELVSEFTDFVDDPKAFSSVQQPGMVMVEQVGFGRRIKPAQLGPEHAVPPAIRACAEIDHCFLFQGILLYSPSHFTVREHAAWAARTGCKRNPFAAYRDPYSYSGRQFSQPLVNAYARLGLDLDLENWPVSMVRMAVPFALRTVTVVAPDAFALPQTVFDEGARRNVEVRVVPHSYFPMLALKKMCLWFSVPAFVDNENSSIDPLFARAFGEPPDANRRLLPKRWLDNAHPHTQPARHA
jgi:hypothetical protein